MDRFVDIKDAQSDLASLIARTRPGTGIVITENGHAIARLAPLDAAPDHRAPDHRAKETWRGVTLAPEFEPGDARLARLSRDGQVPRSLRELPRH